MDRYLTRIPVATAALYDDLLGRAQASLLGDFEPGETLSRRKVKGRDYWYATGPRPARRQRYIGPDGPALRARIEAAQSRATDHADRAGLVRSLRAAGLSAPEPRVGRLLGALAKAGVFRLRAVLVGTHAFVCYPAMLNVRMPQALGRTGDIDIAQDPAISVSVDDAIAAPITEILRTEVDAAFVPAPDLEGPGMVTAWRAPGLSLELLASNRGRRAPRLALPALRAHGKALPFLDFLIRNATPAVVLHNGGVLVSVPDPARFAVHKLIVAARRTDPGGAKARKDILQAEALIRVLATDRPQDLRAAWKAAWGNGAAWRKALREGMGNLGESEQGTLAAIAGS
jgi:hypothetical protein